MAPRLLPLLEWLEVCVEEGSEGQQEQKNQDQLVMLIPAGWGWGAPCGSVVKSLPAMQETLFDPSMGKIPWRREWQSTLVFLSRESHG